MKNELTEQTILNILNQDNKIIKTHVLETCKVCTDPECTCLGAWDEIELIDIDERIQIIDQAFAAGYDFEIKLELF